jgi:hypothetical protein
MMTSKTLQQLKPATVRLMGWVSFEHASINLGTQDRCYSTSSIPGPKEETTE